MRSRCLALVTALAVSFCAARANADDEEFAQKPSPKRAIPDYDGRGAPASGENAGVWVARVFLSPFYVLTEYGVRAPLDSAMGELEAHDDLTAIYDFLAYGPQHKMGFAPVGFVEFGFLPSFGVYGFWNDAIVRNNSFHAHVETWPTDWLAAVFADHYAWGKGHTFDFHASGVNRPDQVFYGIGPDSLESSRSRFREARMDVGAAFDFRLWRSSHLKLSGGLRKIDLSDGHFGSDPSVSREAATGAFPLPFGFDRGYIDPYAGLEAALDTRNPINPRSGFRLEAEGDLGTDIQHGSTGWAHWGAFAHAFFELGRPRRVLTLGAGALFADPLGGDPIPFTELVTLGGNQWMTGYFPGRLRGRSAALGYLRYDWPIASWIDGTIQAVVGNVFDAHLEGFRPGQFRLSGAIGITTSSDVIASFTGSASGQTGAAPQQRVVASGPKLEIVAGFGTSTFDQGVTVQSFHVAFGVPHSF